MFEICEFIEMWGINNIQHMLHRVNLRITCARGRVTIDQLFKATYLI